MKRSMILVAAVFAMASTGLLAQNAEKTDAANSKAVALTDAELDNITAGSATVGVAIFNAGNASVFQMSANGFKCINCAELSGFGITKLIVVQNPGRGLMCVGGSTSCF